MAEADNLLSMTADIAAAYLENNSVPASEIAILLQSIHGALKDLNVPPAAAEPSPSNRKATPTQIRKSITPEALISFEDGRPYKMLRRHLGTRGLTIETYREKWGLPKDYPSTAPAYSEARSTMAKSFGLGKGARKTAQSTKPDRKSRTPKARPGTAG